MTVVDASDAVCSQPHVRPAGVMECPNPQIVEDVLVEVHEAVAFGHLQVALHIMLVQRLWLLF